MKRFTQYLYECQQEKRVRNIGFVKAEFSQMSGSIQIQARELKMNSGQELSVHLFYPKEKGYESVLQGTILKKSSMVNSRLEFGAEDLGKAATTEELAGILLREEDGTSYVAAWNGKPVNEQEIYPKEESCVVSEEKEPDAPEGEVSAEALEEFPEMLEEEPEEVMPPSYVCEKIQRKDLARLPRKEWYLANNNFLLHGWYNYHHLLWLEEGGDLYIGVPGVCHPRECQVARAFGFTRFCAASEVGAGVGREEPGREEDFGYFCRRIRRNE